MPAEAWLWVLSHSDTIDRAVAVRCPRGTDREDMRQDLILQLVRRYHDYDPDRSYASVWIGYQAWAVQQSRRRRNRRVTAADVTVAAPWAVGSSSAVYHCGRGTRPTTLEQEDPFYKYKMRVDTCTEAADRRAEVSRLIRDASPIELDAIQTVLQDTPWHSVRDEIGVSYQARDRRLRRMQNRYLDYLGDSNEGQHDRREVPGAP